MSYEELLSKDNILLEHASESQHQQRDFTIEDLDRCFLFQKNQMLYAMSISQMANPSIHDFVILLSQSQINMDSFCLIKVIPVAGG